MPEAGEAHRGRRRLLLAALLLPAAVPAGAGRSREAAGRPGTRPAGPGAATEPEPPLAEPDPVANFVTEARFALEEPAGARGVRSAEAEPAALLRVLRRRLPILSTEPGMVEVKSTSDIRVRVVAPRLRAHQLRQFCRRGLLEIRSLDEIHSNLNRNGRYLLETININGQYTLRFRDRRTNRPVSTAEMLARSELLASNADLEPGSAQRLGEGLTMVVRVQLTAEASARLRRFTSRPGRFAAIGLDGELASLHAVTEDTRKRRARRGRRRDAEPEEDGFSTVDIAGGFAGSEDAGYLAAVFNSGALPAPLRLLSQGLLGGKTPPPEDGDLPLSDA